MKYVIQAIRSVYPGWEGAVHFNADDTVAKVEPNQGHPMPDMAQVAAAHVNVEKAIAIQEQITALEMQVTPRRIREALLGTDGGWLTQQEVLIQELRSRL